MARRRDTIVEAARDLFLNSGVQGVTMRKVAQKVGISAPGIYRHFKNKDELLAAVVQEGHRIFASYLFQALEGKDPKDRLRLAGLRYLDFAFDHPQYYQIFFMSWNKLDFVAHSVSRNKLDLPVPGEKPKPSPENMHAFQFMIDRVQECISAGYFPADTNVLEVVMLSWSQCHGLAALFTAGAARYFMPPEEYKKLCEAVVDRCINSLMPYEPGALKE